MPSSVRRDLQPARGQHLQAWLLPEVPLDLVVGGKGYVLPLLILTMHALEGPSSMAAVRALRDEIERLIPFPTPTPPIS